MGKQSEKETTCKGRCCYFHFCQVQSPKDKTNDRGKTNNDHKSGVAGGKQQPKLMVSPRSHWLTRKVFAIHHKRARSVIAKKVSFSSCLLSLRRKLREKEKQHSPGPTEAREHQRCHDARNKVARPFNASYPRASSAAKTTKKTCTEPQVF